MESQTPLESSTILSGRYRVDRAVASGGFGTVYAGHHLVLDAPIAIKVLRRERSREADAIDEVATFLDEARMLARLRHPNVVSVLDAGVLGDTALPWMVLEWCEGATLKEALASLAIPMTPRDAWQLLRPIADGIAHAHDQGIAHRDLKPSNVILSRQGEAIVPRVLDFGVAKTDAHEPFTAGDTGTQNPSAYTPAYAAPEQVTQGRTGPWTDVHGLALLFVEILTGRAPYGAENPLEAAVAAERPTPRARGAAVSDTVNRVVARALSLKPAARPPNARVFLAEMDEALLDDAAPLTPPAVTLAAMRPPTPGDDAPRTTGAPLSSTVRAEKARPRLSRLRVLVAAGLLGAPAAFAGVWVSQPRATPSAIVSGAAAAAEELMAQGSRWLVQDGSWQIVDGALLGSGGQVISSAELGDGTLEVDFESVGEAGTHSVGIGFRAQPVPEREDGSGYGLNFALGSDTFQVFRGIHGGWHPIDEAFPTYHSSPAVSPTKNHVVVRAAGGSFAIEVNGQPLAAFQDASYARGRITLWVQSRRESVRFSNFKITAAP